MNIKRFFAPDMRRAIAEVRAALGPDAVIISTRSVDGGVEIVSAVDYDEALLAGMARDTAGAAPAAGPAAGPEAPAAAAAEAAQPSALEAVQQELAAMRGVLREQLARFHWAEGPMVRPEVALLKRQVEGLGLEAELAEAVLQEAVAGGDDATPWRRVLRALARRVRVVGEDPVDAGGVIALVGPTGVGKTTTIAKLAARHCLRHGPESLLLVSTDDFRVGAQRQLEAYGAILGVTVRRAGSSEDLVRLLASGHRKGMPPRLTLIDTAGLAPRDARLTTAMSRLKDVPALRTYLVLPANLQTAVLRQTVRRFSVAGLAGAVLTKVDEAQGLGAVLSVLCSEDLPVAWLSEGQRVPEDLKLARPLHLVSWAAVPPAEPLRGTAGHTHTPPRASVAAAEEACHAAA